MKDTRIQRLAPRIDLVPGEAHDHARTRRLAQIAAGDSRWRTWGTYVSERAWGTVPEDYSANGDAWDFFTHNHARMCAYRWHEDSLAGFCDDQQQICLGLALWNGRDPILKEPLWASPEATVRIRATTARM